MKVKRIVPCLYYKIMKSVFENEFVPNQKTRGIKILWVPEFQWQIICLFYVHKKNQVLLDSLWQFTESMAVYICFVLFCIHFQAISFISKIGVCVCVCVSQAIDLIPMPLVLIKLGLAIIGDYIVIIFLPLKRLIEYRLRVNYCHLSAHHSL